MVPEPIIWKFVKTLDPDTWADKSVKSHMTTMVTTWKREESGDWD
jgi:hypothetical protein